MGVAPAANRLGGQWEGAQLRALVASIALKGQAALDAEEVTGEPLARANRAPPSVDALLAFVTPVAGPEFARVLHVGCKGGHVAAALASLGKTTFATGVERRVVESVARRLREVWSVEAEVQQAEPAAGWPERAPFDAIVSTAPFDLPPQALLAQLSPGGVLVLPLGRSARAHRLVLLRRGPEGRFVEAELGRVELSARVGELLVEMGAVAREVAEEAAKDSAVKHVRIGEALRASGVDEVDLQRALALQSGLPFAHASDLMPRLDPSLARAIPRPFLEHLGVLPVARSALGVLVATSATNLDDADLARVLPGKLLFCLVTATDLRRLWSVVDLAGPRVASPLDAHAHASRDLLETNEGEVAARAVALFDALLLDAIAERASDVHLERYGEAVRVRFRIDGDLHERKRFSLTPEDLRRVVNVVKISAELDIAETRLPQGGRFRRQAGGQSFDLRVQTQPSLHGEHVVVRILPQETKPLPIESLGFPEPIAREYRRLLDSPAGLVLVVGPTGSGKSTTLYAGLQRLARDATRKVISVEDPIEYAVEGVQQSAVRPEIGFAFAQAMRAFVREDPDVILIGEIRDGETALEAIRAAQTGHVVLSTLHCNDAVDAVQRLVDLGMHRNSIASELLAVIAQRLAKRVCEGCRAPSAPDPELLAEVFPEGTPPGFACFRGAGCSRCEGRGTRGRVAVLEYMRVGPALRRAMCRDLPLDELRAAALLGGLVTMRASALQLVMGGVIAFEELRWVLPAERMRAERPDRIWD